MVEKSLVEDENWTDGDTVTAAELNNHAAEHNAMYDGATGELIADVNNQSVATEVANNTPDYVIHDDAGTYKAVGHTAGGAYYEDTDIHGLFNTIYANEGPDNHLYLLPGRYEYAQTFVLDDDSAPQPTIEGSGIGATTIVAADAVDIDAIQLGPVASQTLWFSVEHVKYVGNRANNTTGSCVVEDISGAGRHTDVHFDHVFIAEYPGHGWLGKNSFGYRWTDSLIEFCSGDGIRFDSNDATVGGATFIDGCYIAHNDGWGINTVGTVNVIQRMNIDAEIVDNTAGGATWDANQCQHIRFSGICEGNGGDGVYIGDLQYSRVDVRVVNNAGYGINEQNDFFTQIEAYGNGNTSGLFNRRSQGLNLFNGIGQNTNSPVSGGRWNGRSDIAYDMGGIIYDTNNDNWWLPLEPGATNNWNPAHPIGGDYTGDGTQNRDITLGFTPSLVFVFGSDGTAYDEWRLGQAATGTLANAPAGELSITSGGFQVGDNAADADPNTDTESYQYWAIP